MSRDEEKTRLSLRKLFESLVRVLESGKHEVHAGKIKDVGGIKCTNLTYAFSLKTLVDDKPVVKEFRNAYGCLHESPIEIEPLTDTLDKGTHLIVVVELPGVKEDSIKLGVEGAVLTISADTPAGKIRKEVPLPHPVKTDLIEAAYKNGVLEVKLEKTQRNTAKTARMRWR
jgi:HSP20 family protein